MIKRKRYGIIWLVIILTTGCKRTEETSGQMKKETVKENEKEEKVQEKNWRQDMIIAIDPGHQGPDVDMTAKEENAPGSREMKQKSTGGTKGTFTGLAEYQLNLDISLKLKTALERLGYQVVMTREDNEKAISNQERAKLANDANADICIRIHANGSEDIQTQGALSLIMSPENPFAGELYEESFLLAEKVLNAYCEHTQFVNLGVQTNDTMTGINWSQVPVMILEMGFMTSEHDDQLMADAAFQENMVAGITEGIESYFALKRPEGTLQEVVEEAVNLAETQGEWSVYACGLNEKDTALYNEKRMESASLIKLFVLGAIYENMEVVVGQESTPGETNDFIEAMITISDNDATNILTKRLGNGDEASGRAIVDEFCRRHGYNNTHMGRLLMAKDVNDDNYTTVSDCAAFLQDAYQGKLVNSESILSLLQNQTRRAKIPAGIPEGIPVGNKTGELDDVENDVAIVWGEKEPYILCVMSGDLTDPEKARNDIQVISAAVYHKFEE